MSIGMTSSVVCGITSHTFIVFPPNVFHLSGDQQSALAQNFASIRCFSYMCMHTCDTPDDVAASEMDTM